MDEYELDLNLEEEPNINRTEQRIKNLSTKVKESAEETAAERKAREEAETRATSLEKERDFYASFSQETSKYPQASEHIDAIKEKVLAGYSVEDATVSVLNAEGKLMSQAETTAPIVDTGIGGSAATPQLTQERSSDSMTLEEKRAALIEADNRGDLAEALRRF